MEGGLAGDVMDGRPSITEVATSQQPPARSQPRDLEGVWSDDVVKIGSSSFTLEELLAIAIIAQTIMTGVSLVLELSE